MITFEYLDSETREQLMDLMDGEHDEIIDLIDTLIETNPMYIEELEASLATQDSNGVRNAAHALKSAFAQIGALAMASILKEIEHAGRVGDISGVPALWESAKKEGEKVAQAFESWKTELASL
ncbi:MAG: Hpt domain-containing protein [Bacteroidia bacterium]|nr:Hpt domain-containing protein [Bacteroidia bacterium]